MARHFETNIIDVGATIPDVDSYWLLGVSGAVTATGFFVDRFGNRTGASFSTTVAQGNGTNDPVKLSTAIPSDAVGARVRLSGDVYYDLQPASSPFSTDFESSYARYPKLVADPEWTRLGRA